MAALALSALVYLAAFGLAWVGVISLLTTSIINFFQILLGVIFLGLAWLMRPRLPSFPDRTYGRNELPQLFAFLDRLAAEVGGRRIDAVALQPAFNASYGIYGWRRRRIVEIGLPLWLALDPQERVALMGHELAHGINRDPTRQTFVAGALHALIEVHSVLEPESLFPSHEGLFSIVQLPFRLIQLGLARFVLGVAFALVFLLFRQGQRAEYFADHVAVTVAGRRAALGMLERGNQSSAVGKMTWVGATADPVAAIVAKVRTIPSRESDRLRRAQRLDGSRLDYSHPPMAYRLDIIESLPEQPVRFVLGNGEAARIDDELEQFRVPIGRRIVEDYAAAVSY